MDWRIAATARSIEAPSPAGSERNGFMNNTRTGTMIAVSSKFRFVIRLGMAFASTTLNKFAWSTLSSSSHTTYFLGKDLLNGWVQTVHKIEIARNQMSRTPFTLRFTMPKTWWEFTSLFVCATIENLVVKTTDRCAVESAFERNYICEAHSIGDQYLP